MAMSRDDIYNKIKGVLVDALGVDDEEVTPGASLTGDLGAESIDFLDIVFRLEKAFSIKISQGELFSDNLLQNEQFVQNGKVTDAGMAELRARMPHCDFSKFDADRSIDKVTEIFTVDTLVKFVQAKVG